MADSLNLEHITTFSQAEAMIADLESGQLLDLEGQLAEFRLQLKEFRVEEFGDLSLVLAILTALVWFAPLLLRMLRKPSPVS